MTYEEAKQDKNHYATPRELVEQVYELIDIKSYKNIWLPFDHYDSEFKLVADEMDLNYVNTHICDENQSDFFTTPPPNNCDLIISNPPFGIQTDILKRCFDLIDNHLVKSFCLLLPLTTLETVKRGTLYEKHKDKLSVAVFKKRLKFKGCKQTFNTASCWVGYNVQFGNGDMLMWL